MAIDIKKTKIETVIKNSIMLNTPFDFEIISPPKKLKSRFKYYDFYKQHDFEYSLSYQKIKHYKNIVIIILFTDVAVDYYVRKLTQQIMHSLDSIYKKRVTFYDNYLMLRKEIATIAMLGKIGRNGLFFSKKFGFNCKIESFFMILECDESKSPNYGRKLSFCENCFDCIEKCPKKAIGNYKLKRVMKCANFIDPLFFSPEKMCRSCITSCTYSNQKLEEIYSYFDEINRPKNIWLEYPKPKNIEALAIKHT